MHMRQWCIDDSHNHKPQRHSSDRAPSIGGLAENQIANHRTHYQLRATNHQNPKPCREDCQRYSNNRKARDDRRNGYTKKDQDTQSNRGSITFRSTDSLSRKFRDQQEQNHPKQNKSGGPNHSPDVVVAPPVIPFLLKIFELDRESQFCRRRHFRLLVSLEADRPANHRRRADLQRVALGSDSSSNLSGNAAVREKCKY